MAEYSNPSRANDTWSLPDLEIFQLTATECAERDEDLMHQYMKKHEYRLASMNSRVRERMIDAIVEAEGITGGWFYWYCFPGCMPDSDAFGPFESYAAALADARENAPDVDEDVDEDSAE